MVLASPAHAPSGAPRATDPSLCPTVPLLAEVGFIAGWFIARVTVPAFSPALARRLSMQGFAIIFVSAVTASMAGYAVGLLRGGDADFSAWQGFVTRHGIQDLRAFVRVAYIHNASYLGGLIGLIIAIIYLRRRAGAHHAGCSG